MRENIISGVDSLWDDDYPASLYEGYETIIIYSANNYIAFNLMWQADKTSLYE